MPSCVTGGDPNITPQVKVFAEVKKISIISVKTETS